MIESLKILDEQITVWINQQNSVWLDEKMWFLSSATPFLILILLFSFYANRTLGLKGMWIFVALLLLTFALSDLISVRIFKEYFMRLRPSHTPELSENLHFYLQSNGEFYVGGSYGFVSSHAANFTALITFFIFYIKPSKRFVLALLFAQILVIYSRVYLGVHYVGDVVAGSLLGIVCAWMTWSLQNLIFSNKKKNSTLSP